jgi:hypothetical protein
VKHEKWTEKKVPEWSEQLKYNPVPSLLNSKNTIISYFAECDFLDDRREPVEKLWELPEAKKLLAKQQKDGSWKYPTAKLEIRSQENYDLIETFRILGILVEQYGFTREHPALKNAAEFMFKFQTEEGDLRGIIGNQYMPYYTAAIMELLIKAGYDKDTRIEAGFHWLLNMRQNDGGWAIPFRTLQGKNSLTLMQAIKKPEPVMPDRSKPFSHLVTGVVLRAFAVHPEYRNNLQAIRAGGLLKSRFFQPDKYPDRKASSFWTGFSHPFWFTDLLSSLDSLSQLGFSREDKDIRKALDWFVERQERNGLWNLRMLRTKDRDLPLWLALAISRVFQRFR